MGASNVGIIVGVSREFRADVRAAKKELPTQSKLTRSFVSCNTVFARGYSCPNGKQTYMTEVSISLASGGAASLRVKGRHCTHASSPRRCWVQRQAAIGFVIC